MAYFADLSPYSYGSRKQPGVVHVGWLDATHEFTKGAVPVPLVEKMKKKALQPVEFYRGFHVCELCRKNDARSDSEIRTSREGVTYAAPVLIVHYIEEHGYLPPIEFLRALDEEPNQSPEPTRPAVRFRGFPSRMNPADPLGRVAHL